MRNEVDWRRQVERRLFEVHACLGAARSELELLEAQHAAAVALAEGARARMLAAETALAHREWESARRHEGVLARRCRAAELALRELEQAQGELFDDLLV